MAFSAVSGVNANGFLTTYGLPSLLRCTTALRSFRAAPEFDLGRASVPVALVSAAYGAFSVGTISMPNLFDSEGEVNRNILNYAVRYRYCWMPGSLAERMCCARAWLRPAKSVATHHHITVISRLLLTPFARPPPALLFLTSASAAPAAHRPDVRHPARGSALPLRHQPALRVELPVRGPARPGSALRFFPLPYHGSDPVTLNHAFVRSFVRACDKLSVHVPTWLMRADRCVRAQGSVNHHGARAGRRRAAGAGRGGGYKEGATGQQKKRGEKDAGALRGCYT